MGRWSKLVTVVLVVVIALLAVLQTGIWVQAVPIGEYERTNVTAVDANGTELATVESRVADTDSKRTVGLSRTATLGPDEGMVFVFDEEATRGFVMRGMSFPLDIVFVAANGTVTTVHHAAEPGSVTVAAQLERYSGRAKYVLEVNRGWTNRTGLDEGDRIQIPGETNGTAGETAANVSDESAGDGTSTSQNQTTPGNQTESTRNQTTPGNQTETPERRPVTAVSSNGTELGSVRVRVADTGNERFTGLSETSSLGPDEGMLFVHRDEGEHAYVMRDMDFPLDIVYVAANGTVTRIHHADLPPEGADDLKRYPGTGKYVLEVNQGWTNETGLDVGDRIRSPVIE